MQVAPTCFDGALAKVILLPIAFAETFCVKQSYLLQAVATYVHAEADASGYFDACAGMSGCKKRVQRSGVIVWGEAVFLAETRVAADSGVVGKRCDCADIRAAVGGCMQAIKPLIGDLGVAVQQQYIVSSALCHASVDGAHKAQVVFVFQ